MEHMIYYDMAKIEGFLARAAKTHTSEDDVYAIQALRQILQSPKRLDALQEADYQLSENLVREYAREEVAELASYLMDNVSHYRQGYDESQACMEWMEKNHVRKDRRPSQVLRETHPCRKDGEPCTNPSFHVVIDDEDARMDLSHTVYGNVTWEEALAKLDAWFDELYGQKLESVTIVSAACKYTS